MRSFSFQHGEHLTSLLEARKKPNQVGSITNRLHGECMWVLLTLCLIDNTAAPVTHYYATIIARKLKGYNPFMILLQGTGATTRELAMISLLKMTEHNVHEQLKLVAEAAWLS